MRTLSRPALVVCSALVVYALWLTSLSAQTQGTADLPFPLLTPADELSDFVRAFRERHSSLPGQVLVKFREGYDPQEQGRALSVLRTGRRPLATRWIGDTLLVRSSDEPSAAAMASVLSAQPEVEWAQPNHILRWHATPNDTFYSSQQWNMGLINMPLAWDINRGGSSIVTVAVVDSGVNTTAASFSFPLWNGTSIVTSSVPFGLNPDLSSSRIVAARDFIFWTGPVLDMVGHGTHVAGTVLQETNNSLGYAGVAYASRLMPVKVCVGSWELQIAQSAANEPGPVDPDDGGCSSAAIIAGIRYAADNGAKVINLSLGGPEPSPAILSAITYAVGRGTFVAMSAGNSFEEGNPVEYPAAYAPQVAGAMSVGAVGRSRRRAYYSATGSHIEIAAPGGDFRDGGIDGVVFQAGLDFRDSDPSRGVTVPRFDRYVGVPNQGTSMASPHIAGVAALLVAQGITDPAAVEAAITRSAVDLGSPGKDNDFGHGLVDARAALRGMGVAR